MKGFKQLIRVACVWRLFILHMCISTKFGTIPTWYLLTVRHSACLKFKIPEVFSPCLVSTSCLARSKRRLQGKGKPLKSWNLSGLECGFLRILFADVLQTALASSFCGQVLGLWPQSSSSSMNAVMFLVFPLSATWWHVLKMILLKHHLAMPT